MAIDGDTMETVSDFIFLESKITANSDCSHEIKGHLLLERKTMTNLDSIIKSRDITLLTKVCLVKSSGKTQKNGMGREVGGGIRMGNTCKSVADSCQCMAKTTTILLRN